MTDITTKLRSGEFGWLPELNEAAADEIDRLRAEVAELRIAMQRQAGAVKMLDMSHVARAETMMQHAQVLHDQSNHAALESERSANAALTADVERKDAEIARLREALEQIARPPNIVGVYHSRAVDIARAALAPVEVANG